MTVDVDTTMDDLSNTATGVSAIGDTRAQPVAAPVPTLLVTGTDTEVGKTVVTAAIAAYWQTHHGDRPLGILKPVQAGTGDREQYAQLFALDQSLEELCPAYFAEPIAPPLAAHLEGRSVDLSAIWQTLQRLQRTRAGVLVEGAGGLGSPVTWELTVADLAREWRLPTLLVVPVKLGAIAQAVANVALARSRHLDLRGIVLNCTEPRSTAECDRLAPADWIADLTQIPVLGTLPYQASWDNTPHLPTLAAAAAALDLERLGFFPRPMTINS